MNLDVGCATDQQRRNIGVTSRIQIPPNITEVLLVHNAQKQFIRVVQMKPVRGAASEYG
jgi:hypothetical protein